MRKNSWCLVGVLLLVVPAAVQLAKASVHSARTSAAAAGTGDCCTPVPVPVPTRSARPAK